MKDAFGGSFILRIMLVFFVVFICFMTASITISKTFRIKNNIINMLERSDPREYDNIKTKIDDYLRKVSYNYGNNKNIEDSCKKSGGVKTENGVCIVTYKNLISSDNVESSNDKNVTSFDNVKSVYYKVITYVVVDFPLFHLGTVIPISGETKIIYLDR